MNSNTEKMMKIHNIEVNGQRVDLKSSLHVTDVEALRRLIAELLIVPPASVYICYRESELNDRQTKLDL